MHALPVLPCCIGEIHICSRLFAVSMYLPVFAPSASAFRCFGTHPVEMPRKVLGICLCLRLSLFVSDGRDEHGTPISHQIWRRHTRSVLALHSTIPSSCTRCVRRKFPPACKHAATRFIVAPARTPTFRSSTAISTIHCVECE